jgi:tRNA threonylcarbamoyladenosine biosynthesis protein TsaB
VFLSIDTSTLILSLALVEGTGPGARVVEQLEIGPPKKQSELLPGVIGELLERHAVKLAELEGIAIGLGPGSFTGLRIGLATVKALAYAARLKVGRASSLAAMALEGPEGALLLSCAVARVGELYIGRYRRQGDAVVLEGEEDALTPEELARELLANPDARVLGQAVATARTGLLAAGVPESQLLATPVHPSALAIAKVARFPESFDLQALFALEPHYVRGSAAERNPKFPPLPGPTPQSRLRDE